MLEKIGGKRSSQQRMRWLDDSMDMNLSKLWEIVENRGALCAAIQEVANSWTRLSDSTTFPCFLFFFTEVFINQFVLVHIFIESEV